MQTKKDKRKNAEVSIIGTLPKERIAKETEKTLAQIQKEIAIAGFRKGHVPMEKVREYVGEKALWKESAESALKAEVENILKEHAVLPILPVSASLSSGDPESDIPFEIVAVVAPSCEIEGYKETAKFASAAVPPLDETKEQDLARTALRNQARAMTKSALPADLPVRSQTQAGALAQAGGTGELTDEEAKKLGFENSKAVEYFLSEEAERAVKEREVQKKRGAIAEALIAKANCDIPHVIVHEEASHLLEATKKDIASQGLPFNDYLKRAGKTEQEIHTELESPAEKRVALDLIFAEIARTEKIEAAAEEETRLVEALLKQGVPEDRARPYVRATIMREKVWELLGAKAESKV